MVLGDIIKKFREENNLSMQNLADMLGTTRSYIHMLEHNKNPKTNKPVNPSIETIKQLSKIMRIDIDDLLKMLDSNQGIVLNEDMFEKQFSSSAVPVLRTC